MAYLSSDFKRWDFKVENVQDFTKKKKKSSACVKVAVFNVLLRHPLGG